MEITENTEIEALFGAGAHIGYTKSRRHPKMSEFVFGTRNNVEVFDLVKTESRIKEAEEFLKALGRAGAAVLWVGTKPPARAHIESVGKKTKSPYVFERWLGGTLTNFKIFEGRLGYLAKLEAEEASGEFEKYSKKERMMKMLEIRKLARMFGGLRLLKALPAALVIVDPGEEKTALAEAERKNIPVAALLNVDCDPRGVNYLIPLNDNSSAAIALVLARLGSAYEAGAREKEKEQTAQS
ncbi:30S ribosomal protein S2 [Candidatus Giovannonibacteria bacterium RIFCSPHIGHO2_01_FULL_45_24]|uniref:Small ribosomal subunit protein uS2 n=1 Tax=Candidatus Giovannonibacteria bacterium RIFCSPLOWO2_01_FULL_46_32 TaxID=1798353 RepID=A0A1F5XHG3_9BACT|nr:MAG: 30S ribosomal protein S2 [Candidatus Giovannonibacteria bacterium RIFCSPHIGHO2_01_FULL_45_24]OGF87364.1 MAG: 30S ribosomal protein S2 [Candidatus Giovannonibacteria bacterium RIFCSPLOWO2_01_FULL_46_32]